MRRQRAAQDEEHEGSQDRWLVSYADFITLMFAFFVVLYATSEKDLGQAKEFQESLKRFMIKGVGGLGGPSPTVNQGELSNTPIEPPIQTFKRGKLESVEALQRAEQFVEENFTAEERQKYIQDVGSDEWGVRIILKAGAIFSTGSERFKEDAVGFVGKLSGVLAKSKNKVMIEGHVQHGEKGSFRSTWDFASARAINMLRYLQAKQDLPAGQFVAAAFGDSRPLMEDKNSAMNSRLEIVLLNQDLEL